MRAAVLVVLLAATVASAQQVERKESWRNKTRGIATVPTLSRAKSKVGFRQSPERANCGLPFGPSFPGFVGRAVVAPNAADAAEVTRGWMADGSDMGVTAGTGAMECAWTPPNASGCLRAEKIVGTTTAVPRIVAGSVPESLRTLFAADHTMYFVVRSGTTGNRYSFGYGAVLARGFYLLHSASNTTASWQGAGTDLSISIGAVTQDKVSIVAVRKSGTSYTICLNGVCNAPVTNALAIVNPTTADTLYLGAHPTGSNPLNGQFVAWYPFNAAHSNTEIANFSAQAMCAGGSTPAGQVNFTNAVASARYELMAAERENLLKDSENLDSANWTINGGGSITPNQGVDSTGATTLEQYTSGAVGFLLPAAAPITADGVSNYSFTAEVKTVSGTSDSGLRIRDSGANVCVLNFTASTTLQTVTCTTSTPPTAGTSISVRVYPSVTSTGTIQVGRLWLRRSSVMTGYTRSFADLRHAGPFYFPHGDNGRWCFANGCRSDVGIINAALQRRDLGNISWTKEASVTAAGNSASCPLSRMRDGVRMSLVDNTAGANTASVYQNITVTSSTGPFHAAFDMASTSGTVTRTMGISCGAANAATCSCSRDDGATCTATMVGPRCNATSSATPTPVRVAVSVTCATATTIIAPFALGGQTGTSTGTACYDLASGTASGAVSPLAYCDNPTQTSTASCGSDNMRIPQPTGPTTTEGCAKICINPSWTGPSPYGVIYYLSANTAHTARIAYSGTSTDLVSAYNGSVVVSVAAGFTYGTTKCYVTDWSAAGNFLRVTNLSSGATTSGAFSGFPSLEANWSFGSTVTGTGQVNASLSGLKFGSGPGQCN